jgi:hypothetical protein
MFANDYFSEDIKVVGGLDFQATTKKKALGPDGSGAFVLLQEQPADEETAEDKENVHARLTLEVSGSLHGSKNRVADRRQAKVMRHDHEDGDRSDEVQLGVALLKVGSGGKKHAETDLLRTPDAALRREAAGNAVMSSGLSRLRDLFQTPHGVWARNPAGRA